MATIEAQTPVGRIVTEHPFAAAVFEELGIDYCCGGNRPLDEACLRRKLDVRSVLDRIQERLDSDSTPDGRPDAMTLTALADHIEATHHAFLRRELPRIDSLIRKVVAAHGADDPRLQTVYRVFQGFAIELNSHMMKEEQILFPMIRTLETATTAPCFHCGSVANPIRVMMHEHDDAGDALKAMRELTDNYSPPQHACPTYVAMLDALRRLELEMHQHVHKENNILFPRAAERERQMSQSVSGCRMH